MAQPISLPGPLVLSMLSPLGSVHGTRGQFVVAGATPGSKPPQRDCGDDRRAHCRRRGTSMLGVACVANERAAALDGPAPPAAFLARFFVSCTADERRDTFRVFGPLQSPTQQQQPTRRHTDYETMSFWGKAVPGSSPEKSLEPQQPNSRIVSGSSAIRPLSSGVLFAGGSPPCFLDVAFVIAWALLERLSGSTQKFLLTLCL